MKQLVHKFYTNNSDARYTNRGSIEDVSEFYRNMLTDFINSIEGDRVIDCGCGVGRDTRYMREHSLNTVGVDISRFQLEYVTPPAIQADMSSLCFKSSSIDGIWVPNSVFYLSKQDAKDAFTEFNRILSSHGVLSVGFKIGDETQEKTLERWGDSTPYMQYTKKDALELVTNGGFVCMDRYTTSVEGTTFMTVFCQHPEQ